MSEKKRKSIRYERARKIEAEGEMINQMSY